MATGKHISVPDRLILQEEPQMATIDRRDKFLLQMYNVFWSNISRAEEAAWKMLAVYAALFAGLSFALSTIGLVLFLVLIILFSFCGAALSLNANLWFVRNINLISNLEKEFLYASDYDVLIPIRYQKQYPFLSQRTFEVWWVLAALYFAVGTITPAILFSQIKTCAEVILVVVTYLISLILTIGYGFLLKARHESLLKSAPGTTPRAAPTPPQPSPPPEHTST